MIHGTDPSEHTEDWELRQPVELCTGPWLGGTNPGQRWVALKGLENWPGIGTTAYRKINHKYHHST